ncbi:MAG: hypothetical protein JWP92_3545 [Caulobacter sp.]|nr:hypothetical protein [Caulobacter sp.]
MNDEDYVRLSSADAYEYAIRRPGAERVRLFAIYKKATGGEALRGVPSEAFKPLARGDDAPVKCPSCESPQIHAEKRGWTWMSGLIGGSKIMLTCLRCGHRFRPGEGL